jgi:glucose 1-dehydrogenase
MTHSHDWLGLTGRVCVVTGGGSGIGEGIARELSAAGAHVAVLDRDAAGAARVAAELSAKAAKAISITCDVTREADVADAAKLVRQQLGSCTVLVNNAGILRSGALDEVSIDTWNAVLAINLTGYLIAARAFGADMLAAKRGSIIHISSIAGLNQQPRSGAYSASKAGVIMLSKQLSVEWGVRGVRSNVVMPGLIRTPLAAAFYADPVFEAKRVAMVPARRIGEPQDIANAVTFLASDRASYVNGAEVLIDGGLDGMLMDLVPRPGF